MRKLKCRLGALCSEKYVLESYRTASTLMEGNQGPRQVTSKALRVVDLGEEYTVSVVIYREEKNEIGSDHSS